MKSIVHIYNVHNNHPEVSPEQMPFEDMLYIYE